MKRFEGKSRAWIHDKICQNYKKLYKPNQKLYAEYYTKYPFWGKLDPQNGVYDAFDVLASMLCENHSDLINLYERMGDARSKNVLFAILSNWLEFDTDSLSKYKENQYPEYFNPTVFPVRPDEVFVDAGAYNGDSAASFIKNYQTYKRIYCYEITPDVFSQLESNLASLPNVELRKKAVGSEPGTLYVSEGFHDSANILGEKGGTSVDVVRIDDDVTEPVTFIKMDIEGAEQSALRGCARHIRESRPNLAICTYHGYEDIIAVPKLIDEIAEGYKFYMRHHGGNLVPTEFSLLAVWNG